MTKHHSKTAAAIALAGVLTLGGAACSDDADDNNVNDGVEEDLSDAGDDISEGIDDASDEIEEQVDEGSEENNEGG